MMKKILLSIAVVTLAIFACKPDRDDEIQLPPAPGAPDFSIEMLVGDSNRVVVKDLSEGSFQRLWDFPGGTPLTSTRALDTVFFAKKGEYLITLFVSKSDGSGTPSTSKKVVILTDAPVTCTPKMAMLTGDCNALGKCWTLSRDAGAVKVGPTYDDFSWYTSPADGLQNEQYDDGFCFTFENLVFQNRNNGASVNPWNGYQAQPLDPGVSVFTFSEGTGILGRDQILLPDDQFMGVWDCDNLLDVVKLSADELIVRGRQRAQNGAPLAQGWFELRFVPQ
ncbi:MAG: hypothetical protein OHK0019_06830 [Saprospiraceae bacterium]